MNFHFKRGAKDSEDYQVFFTEFGNFNSDPAYEPYESHIDMIVKSFLFNQKGRKNPYCFKGFLWNYGRFPKEYDNITITIYDDLFMTPIIGNKMIHLRNAPLLLTDGIISVINWEYGNKGMIPIAA